MKTKLTCPCCGFRTIGDDAYGSYDICPVCGWKDDPVQRANPCSRGGANKESLHECQMAVASWTKERMAAFERDSDWRPLNEEEVAYFEAETKKEHWTFRGKTAPELAYWRQPQKIVGT